MFKVYSESENGNICLKLVEERGLVVLQAVTPRGDGVWDLMEFRNDGGIYLIGGIDDTRLNTDCRGRLVIMKVGK